jgi:hypothetical protein
MPALSDYTAGTITLTNNSTAFTGSGTGWQAADFREGDTILGIEDNAGVEYVIATITGNGAGTLTQEWEGATGTYQYRMRYMADGARVTAQARNLIELLGNGSLQALAGLTGPGVPVFNGPHSMVIKPEADFINGVAYNVQVDTLADRDAYDGQSEGFAVLVSDVGDGRSALFSKASNTSGDWTDPAYITGPVGDTGPEGPQGDPGSGFNWIGEYNPANSYVVDDVVGSNGSTFIAIQAVPPGETPSGAYPPVDTAYWQVIAVRGQDGTGTGDVVGPASAVADRIAVFDGTTGKLIKDGGVTVSELVPADGSITNAKLADVAAATVKGRAVGAGTGAPTDLTAAQVLAITQSAGGYGRSNILGVVSQSGGVPTGAIIERGSNANGEFVRYADGTQICTRVWSITVATTALGQIHRDAAPTGAIWTFPAVFSAEPAAIFAPVHGASWCSSFQTSTTESRVVYYSAVAQSTGISFCATAIGRWF